MLDIPLALSTHGLLMALRLGGEFDLWLVRDFWQILDNREYWQRNREELGQGMQGGGYKGIALQPPNMSTEQMHFLESIYQQWDFVRSEKDLGGMKLYWVGDGKYESFFPPNVHPSLVERYELLAGALEEKDTSDVLEDTIDYRLGFPASFRDTLALTAALIPQRGFILSTLDRSVSEGKSARPRICEFFEGLRFEVIQIPRKKDGTPLDPLDERTVAQERSLLDQSFVRAGLSELMWAGLRLVAIHVVLPAAVLIPERSPDEWNPHDYTYLWKDGKIFWYCLT